MAQRRNNQHSNAQGKRSSSGSRAKLGAASAQETSSRIKRDLLGASLLILAVALFVAALLPQEAVVASAVSHVMHITIGLGAYLLPLFMAGIGIALLVRSGAARMPARVVWGLLIIFIALLSLFALFTPSDSSGNLNYLFDENVLSQRGGYTGAGIAWLGITLVGQTISCVLYIGLILIGLILVGLSISSFVERVGKLREESMNGKFPKGIDLRGKTAKIKREQMTQPNEGYIPASKGKVAGKGKAVEDDFHQADTVQFDTAQNKRKSSPKATGARDYADATLTFVPAEPLSGDILEERARKGVRLFSRKPQATSEKNGLCDTALASDEAQGENDAAASSKKSKKRSDKTVAFDAKMTRRLGERSPAASSAASNAASAAEEVLEAAGGFALPSMALLNVSKATRKSSAAATELKNTAAHLQETLADFGVNARVVDWVAGPTVTLFKIDLPPGVRVSKITNLSDDIALALASPGVRIFSPVPGTNYVGIEVPNRQRQTVYLGDVIKACKKGPLQMAIGKNVEGECITEDLASMPHLLIGGTTGSGKSVLINSMIMSILMRATPSEVRLILVDPKRVEFSLYNDIPHLYVPVVTEPKEAASALSWGVAEMERRLKEFSDVGARNISQYNAKMKANYDSACAAGEEAEDESLPYIVIVIDELTDLMMNVGKEVEFSISRIAQLARAAGIHLIVATQRPSANVVTGLIKANITNRIACNVATNMDSRVILDTPGAEKLIGNGDMLFNKPGFSKPQRLQGCFVSEEEINAVVEELKQQGTPDYHSEILKTNLVTIGSQSVDGSGSSSGSDDPLLWEAAELVVSSGVGSTSNIQRRLKVGYSRAGRIMDMLEDKGIVGPANGSKPRDVLVDQLELETLKTFEMND